MIPINEPVLMESRSLFSFRGSTVKLCWASTGKKRHQKHATTTSRQVLVASEEMAQEAGAFWGGTLGSGGTFVPPEMRQVVAKMELYQSNNMPRIYMTKLIGCLFLD